MKRMQIIRKAISVFLVLALLYSSAFPVLSMSVEIPKKDAGPENGEKISAFQHVYPEDIPGEEENIQNQYIGDHKKSKKYNDPYYLMYDSNELLAQKIDEMPIDKMTYPENMDRGIELDKPDLNKQNKLNSADNQGDVFKKNDQKVQGTKERLKKIAINGDISEIKDLDIPVEIEDQIDEINEAVKEDRFIVKYRSKTNNSLSALMDGNSKAMSVKKSKRSGNLEKLVLDEKVNPKDLADILRDLGADEYIQYIQPDFKMYYAAETDSSLELEFDENVSDQDGTEESEDSSGEPEDGTEEPEGGNGEPESGNQEDGSEETEMPKDTETEFPNAYEELIIPEQEPEMNLEDLKRLEVIVAVIDTGIDISHRAFGYNTSYEVRQDTIWEDLLNNDPDMIQQDTIWSNLSEVPDDWIDNDGNGYIDDITGWNFYDDNRSVYNTTYSMQNAHGTHIAGIIANAAQDYPVKIMPLRVFGENGAYTSDIIDAINYAEANGAKVVNCSFGSSEYNFALEETIANSSMLFVCAVGNARSDLAVSPVYPACFDLDNVISVASTNADGGFSYYSNYNAEIIDIAARGRDVYSTLPEGEYGLQSGTSMSAAQVTGIAAAAVSVQGDLDAYELKEKLINTADMLSNLQNKVVHGRQVNLKNVVRDIEQTQIKQNTPAEDFDIHGYNPTQDELYQLYSGSGDVIQIASGTRFNLILKEDGTVWAWGDNQYGQCGNGTTSDFETLTQVIGLTNVAEIAAGGEHSLAVKSDGTVWAWGYNNYGQLGDGTTTDRKTPVQVSGLINAVDVTAGSYHSLAVKSDGTVWAWGRNYDGQLGDGTTTNRKTPVQVSGLINAVDVTAGSYHSLAVKSDGTVWVWGDNWYGQLGDGTTTNRTTPVQVSGLTNVAGITAGSSHSLAVKSDGTVWAWGYNSGQLGDGTTMDRKTPVQVSGLTNVVGITAGYSHSLAVKSDGTVWAWGYNSYGRLGDGTTVRRTTPVQVSGLTNVVGITAGYSHSLAVKSDGTVWAWGDNSYGQLGDGTTAQRTTPVQVSGLTDVVGVAAGFWHSLAVKSDGTVWAWGNNVCGQLGDGTYNDSSTPVQVSGLTDVVGITAGYSHSLAVKSDGTVWAWGDNSYGQLGDGTTAQRTTPVQISGLTDVVGVVAGGDHSLAVKSDGTVWAWGNNSWGQLGDGTYNDSSTPVQVSGLTDVAGIGAGFWHSLAVKSDGTVWAWGNNVCGQLGDGTYNDSSTPVQVSGLTDVVGIGVGCIHSLAVESNGTVWAWGDNFSGQLGDGTYNGSSTPVQVSGLTDVVGIGAGDLHSLAVESNGTVWAWGDNSYGQLGDDTYDIINAPVQVSGLTDVVGVSAGLSHSLSVKWDGTVWAWGNGFNGQLGDSRILYALIPIQSPIYLSGDIRFIEEFYTAVIPDSGSRTITVLAQATDEFGEVISGADIVYSLTSTYTGVFIDSGTGVVTITPQAQAGSVQISASYDGSSCVVNLELIGSTQLTVTAQADRSYNVCLSVNNITSFAERTFTVTYDPSVLQLTDLCASTHEKELTVGEISQAQITVLNYAPGSITFKINKTVPQSKKWSGVMNIFTFNALSTQQTTIGVQ